MKALARFKNVIWNMDHAFVGKLATEFIGTKYLLVRQNLFDRTVYAKGMESKDSKETVEASATVITKRIVPKKFGLTKGKSLLEIFKNSVVPMENNFSPQ